jgi:ATP-dependent helicase/nuclease subunit B
VEVTLLLGPAGTGKTFRCLKQARQELKRSPDGAPLVFLTPKQATYQIERELLADPDLPGFTRLKVAGFEALARLTLAEAGPAHAAVLSDLGRVMMLRALVAQEHGQLRTFHASARMQGFAQQLSAVLSELQQARLSPEEIRQMAGRDRIGIELRDKLLDLARLLEGYNEWLRHNDLYDSGRLLGVAAEILSEVAPLAPRAAPRFGGLWLDGFAELSEQELEFLAALIQRSERTTLAFCTDAPASATPAWHSIWSSVSRTVRRCHARLQAIPNARVTIQELSRQPAHTRFADPNLAYLEEHWASGTLKRELQQDVRRFKPAATTQQELMPFLTSAPAVKVVSCRNVAEEAVVCAREILSAVRGEGRRFRDIAVLLRSFNGYDDVLCRVFARYEIPFFIDRREPVAHHPLTELVRYALRLPRNQWAQEDWLGALKTGLLLRDEEAVDALENEALAKGWEGEAWLQPFPDAFEKYREKFVPPFQRFADATRQPITGPQLTAALGQLFSALDVAATLQRWSEAVADDADGRRSLLRAEIHTAVWSTFEDWMDALELAFEKTTLPLSDWLPVIEAGLGNLTVGVIPPSLDQVLIGTVDRSRNPDLKMAIVMGLNETVFPAPPAAAVLLSEYDREVLRDSGVLLGNNTREQLGIEQYLAYIACTRARERLVLTYAERDGKDRPLNPSSIVQHVKDLLPHVEEKRPEFDWREALHASELITPLLKGQFEGRSIFAPILERFKNHRAACDVERLPRELVAQLYGSELNVSVSQLEDYAACSFKFFVKRGLRADERKEFKVDSRMGGIFQHEVLRRFHEQVTADGKRWRDIKPAEAAKLVRRIGERVREELEGGIFTATPEWRFAAESIIQGLERLIAVLIGWAPQYEFEPQAVELGFGGPGDPLPAWKIDLGDGRVLALRGRIDRVDLDKTPDGRAWVVVMDYKASGQKVEDIRMRHGLDLQLVGYLAALRSLPEALALLKCAELCPGGGFYLKLRNTSGSADSREEALAHAPEIYKHVGRFRSDLIPRFDNRGERSGDQFNFRKTKSDALDKRCKDPVDGIAFAALVAETEDLLRRFGQAICDGDVRINPFRHREQTACSKCDYAAICRFDSWEQSYRSLRDE